MWLLQFASNKATDTALPSTTENNVASEGTDTITRILQSAGSNLDAAQAVAGQNHNSPSKGVSEATAALVSSDTTSESSSGSSPDSPDARTADGATMDGLRETADRSGGAVLGDRVTALDDAQAEAVALVARLEEKLRRRQEDLACLLTPDGRALDREGEGVLVEGGEGGSECAEYFDARDTEVVRAESGGNEWHDAPEELPVDNAAPSSRRPPTSTVFNPLDVFGFGGLGRSV